MPLRYMNTVAKRLSYVLRQYRDPGVLYWTTRAAMEIQGIHDVTVPTEPRPLLAFVQKLEPRLGTNPYEKYLPWVAQQLNKRARRREGLGQIGLQLSRRLRAIAEWAEAERVDLGRVDAEQAIAKAQEYEAELEDDVPQGKIVLPFDDGFTIQQLTTEHQLDAEGVTMQHCVGSYCDAVSRGAVHIYSLRDAKGKPHVTIEYDPYNNTIVQVRGKQNDEPLEKYWPYVGKFIEYIGAKTETEIPEDIMNAVSEAYEEVQSVESDAKYAQELMDQALQEFKDAKYHDAVETAERATAVEGKYGDHPATGPFYDEVHEAYEDMEDDDDTPLYEIPEGTKHPRHDELLSYVEKAHDSAEGVWVDMSWDYSVDIWGNEWYYDSDTFQDVSPGDPYPGLREVATDLCEKFRIDLGEAEDVSKYIKAARHHRWSRAANRVRLRSNSNTGVFPRPRVATSQTRRLKRRLSSY